MSRQKRIFIVSMVAILFVSVAAIPCLSGYWYGKRILLEQKILAANNPDMIFSTDLHHGWLTSDVVWHITPRTDTNKWTYQPHVVIRGKIHHGPIALDPVSNRWRLAMATWTADGSVSVKMPQTGFQITISFMKLMGIQFLSGNSNTRLTIPPAGGELPQQGGTWKWEGMQADVQSAFLTADLLRLNLDVNMGAAQMTPAQVNTGRWPTVRIDPIRMTGNSLLSLSLAAFPSTGQAKITSPLISLTSQQGSLFIRDMELSDKLTLRTPKKMDFTLDYRLGQLEATGQFIEPTGHFSLKNSSLSLALQNLNPAGVKSLLSELSTSQDSSNKIAQTKKASHLQTVLSQPLQSGTLFNLQLNADTSLGTLSTAGNILSKGTGMSQSPMEIALGLTVKFDLRLSDTMANSFILLNAKHAVAQQGLSAGTPEAQNAENQFVAAWQAQLQNLVSRNYFAYSNNTYTTTLTYDNGILMANGLPLPPPVSTPPQ